MPKKKARRETVEEFLAYLDAELAKRPVAVQREIIRRGAEMVRRARKRHRHELDLAIGDSNRYLLRALKAEADLAAAQAERDHWHTSNDAHANCTLRALEILGSPVTDIEDAATVVMGKLAAAQAARDKAERTVASVAAMLGWGNVPPQETLERDIAALKARAALPAPDSGQPAEKP